MNKVKDGGPAFPQPMTMDQEGNFHHSAEHPDGIGGMTLRQYYAGEAMKGLLSFGESCTLEETATRSVEYADALIAELERER